MASEAALLVRYQVLAANRRHFETLFFAVVAFVLAFAMAIQLWSSWFSAAMLTSGGLVAHRLLQRERASFEAMRDCWAKLSVEPPVASEGRFRPGAMALVVTGLYAAGSGIALFQLAS